MKNTTLFSLQSLHRRQLRLALSFLLLCWTVLAYGFIPRSYQANLGIDHTFVSDHRSTFFKSANVLVDFETSSLAHLLRDLVEARFTLDAFV